MFLMCLCSFVLRLVYMLSWFVFMMFMFILVWIV